MLHTPVRDARGARGAREARGGLRVRVAIRFPRVDLLSLSQTHTEAASEAVHDVARFIITRALSFTTESRELSRQPPFRVSRGA